MEILLTGATGFIGSFISERRVIGKINALSSTIKINRTCGSNTSLIGELKKNDVVLHCAGLAHGDHTQADLDNVNHLGTLELASAAEKAGVRRFIFLSSVNVHGLISDIYPINETSEKNSNISPSKFKAEQALLRLSKESEMEITIIRSVLVYGKGAPANMGLLIKLASYVPFTPFGLLRNKRSYISISNLCDFISLCISHPKAGNQEFLISDDYDVSTKKLINLIASGRRREIFHIPVPIPLVKLICFVIGRSKQFEQLTGSLQVDISKAKNILGWSPIETMEQAMDKLK
jgi:nucleoside-diphosphate-sugar epimerase